MPLVRDLCSTFVLVTRSTYDFTGRDATAVKALLTKSDDNAEIVYRWRIALSRSADPFHTPKVRTLPQLVQHWNACAVVTRAAPAHQRHDPNDGIVRHSCDDPSCYCGGSARFEANP